MCELLRESQRGATPPGLSVPGYPTSTSAMSSSIAIDRSPDVGRQSLTLLRFTMLMIRVGVAAAAMPTATVPLYSSPARGKHSSVLTPSSALTTSPSTTTSRRTPTADASLQVDAAAWWNHAGADAAAARGSIPPDPSLGASAGLSSPTATPPSSHNSADAPLPPRNAAGAIVPLPVNPLSAQLSAAAGGRITAIRRFSTAHGLDGSGAVNALTAVSSRPSLDAAGVLTPSQPLVMHAPGTLGTRPSDVSGALLP